MSDMDESKLFRRRQGRAFRNLRLRAGKAQHTLAGELGITPQSLSAWETGKALPAPDRKAQFFQLVGASQAKLDTEIALIADDELSPAAPTPDVAPAHFASGLVSLAISDELLWPWVGQGEHVYYEFGRAPRRGEFCVVALKNGKTVARQYEKREGDRVFLRTLNPDEPDTYLWSEIRGLHRIGLRGD